MANVNKVILIGRLTRDPELRSFSNGGRVAKFGFAVTNRRKNAQGEWEDEPMFIDCEAYNRGDFSKVADTIEKFAKKGTQLYIEGRLHLDQWDDKQSGAKRSKHKIVVDTIQLLDGRQGGEEGGEGGGARTSRAPARSGANGARGAAPGDNFEADAPDDFEEQPRRGRSGGGSPPPEDDIPF